MNELQHIIEQKQELLARESISRPTFDYTLAVMRGRRWQQLIIASSVQSRCRDALHGSILVSFLLKYLTDAGILSVCDRTKSDWQYANS